MDELSAVVAINNSSVILVTESWLSSDIPDSIINIGNTYNSYRLDKPTPGGGILARKRSALAIIKTTQNTKTLQFRHCSRCIIIYYPPVQSKENEHEMLDYLTQKMDIALAERPSAGIFVTGDFNKLDLNS